MTRRSPLESKNVCIAAMGKKLGSQYAEIWQEVAYLHRKWIEYVNLFGSKPSRVALLNKSAPTFFRLVQDLLWENVLLHIARLTDKSESGCLKNNLTIQNFPELINDDKVKREVQLLIKDVVAKSEFCRDWRNRHIAHRDLLLTLDPSAVPLKLGNRKQVDEILDAITRIMDAISGHYLDSSTYFRFDGFSDGVVRLLFVLDDGVKAELARRERIKTRSMLEGDFSPRDL